MGCQGGEVATLAPMGPLLKQSYPSVVPPEEAGAYWSVSEWRGELQNPVHSKRNPAVRAKLRIGGKPLQALSLLAACVFSYCTFYLPAPEIYLLSSS